MLDLSVDQLIHILQVFNIFILLVLPLFFVRFGSKGTFLAIALTILFSAFIGFTMGAVYWRYSNAILSSMFALLPAIIYTCSVAAVYRLLKIKFQYKTKPIIPKPLNKTLHILLFTSIAFILLCCITVIALYKDMTNPTGIHANIHPQFLDHISSGKSSYAPIKIRYILGKVDAVYFFDIKHDSYLKELGADDYDNHLDETLPPMSAWMFGESFKIYSSADVKSVDDLNRGLFLHVSAHPMSSKVNDISKQNIYIVVQLKNADNYKARYIIKKDNYCRNEAMEIFINITDENLIETEVTSVETVYTYIGDNMYRNFLLMRNRQNI